MLSSPHSDMVKNVCDQLHERYAGVDRVSVVMSDFDDPIRVISAKVKMLDGSEYEASSNSKDGLLNLLDKKIVSVGE